MCHFHYIQLLHLDCKFIVRKRLEVSHIKDFEHKPTSEQLLESTEVRKKIAEGFATISEENERFKRSAEDAVSHIPNSTIMTLALDAAAESSKAMKLATDVGATMNSLKHNSIIQTVGKNVIAANAHHYAFKNTLLEKAVLGMPAMFQSFNNSVVKLVAKSVHKSIKMCGPAFVAVVHSPVMDWLQSIDISSIRFVLENLASELDDPERYKKLKQIYLTTMYECKWFPYVGLIADFSLTMQILDIMETSRGASKRREKRIDRVILDYYDKDRIKSIKRCWNEFNLESYIKRILKQALEAHLRGEYALCVSSLATMWEGLIYIKANNATMQDRHRQKMGITKKALEDLTVANDYGQIFSDYFNNFIVSQCNTIDDVVDGVPNRHSVSHSWYRKYPSKKASLNAILLTDFILGLEPLENNQESA